MAIDSAEQAAGDDPGLLVEALAARSTLHIRTEEYDRAAEAARHCLRIAESLRRLTRRQILAVLHARVSRGTVLASDGAPVHSRRAAPAPTSAARRADGLAELDEVAAHPAADRDVVDRAVNNALVARLWTVRRRVTDGAAQVDAWLWVARARDVAGRRGSRGLIVRQAVDLAVHTGQWERGWDHLTDQLDHEERRSEQVALAAKGAQLAWSRGDLVAARRLGQRALTASTGVDVVWSRLYGHLGGLIAAAAGAGPVTAALTAYARCVDQAGHESRENRAWEAAQTALEAGRSATEVRAWLARLLPRGIRDDRLRALADLVLSDHAGHAPDPATWAAVDVESLGAVDRARCLSARGRAALRAGRETAAMVDLQAARLALRDWPGRVRDEVDATAAALLDPPDVTAAQARVLDLLVEGMGNQRIAEELGCAERTVAVHVSRLLHATGAPTRTRLAVREIRRRMMTAG